MQTSKILIGLSFVLMINSGCSKQDYTDTSFVNTATAPAEISASVDITQDNSGLVTITPTGEGASSYSVYFGDTTTMPGEVIQGKSIQHRYPEGNYQVRIVAHNFSGQTAEITKQISLSFRSPENLKITAAVDASKKQQVNVTATALYATGFQVYFGDVPNESPQLFAIGAPITHVYSGPGTYTVRVVALGGSASTIEATTTVTILDLILLPLTFESTTLNYAFTNFGGGVASVISNPQMNGINTSSKVGQMIKGPGEVYGGSLISLGSPIDFSGSKTFKMKVFSPRVGAKVLLKVENPTNNSQFYEKEVTTTVANAWEQLTFDYSGVNTANTYQNVVLIFDNGTRGDGSANFTFLFDDITLN